MASEAIPSPFAGLEDIFKTMLGASTQMDSTQSLDIQSLINQLTGVNSSENTTGSTSGMSQALSTLLSTLTGNTNTQNTNVEQTNANIASLQEVYNRQKAGLTPDALAAIFREGAKAAPQLISATSNAVGARAGSNSATDRALTSLNSDLTSKAAMMNQQMLSDSATTANLIAQLTKSVSNTGNQNQSTSQTKNDSTNSTTMMTQQQALQKLIESMTSMNQTQNQTQTKEEDTDTLTGINLPQTGMAAGLAGLMSLFSMMGGSGGSSGGSNSWLNDLMKLFGGGSSGYPTNPVPDGGDSDGLPNPGDGYHDPSYDPPADDLDGYADGGRVPKFADGGKTPEIVKPITPQLKLTESKNTAPSVDQLMQMLAGGGGFGSGVNLAGLMPTGGGGSGTTPTGSPGAPVSGTGADADANSSNAPANDPDAVGHSVLGISTPTLGQALGLGLNAVTGNMLGLALGIGKLLDPHMVLNPVNVPPVTPMTPVTFPSIPGLTTDGSANAGGSPSEGAVGSVSVGSDADAANPGGVTGPSGETGATSSGSVGGDGGGGAAGDNGAGGGGDGGAGGGGGTGSSGDGSGSAGSGWADGGRFPKQKNDKKGIQDKINISVSGGEYIVPTDVVDMMGEEFFDAIKMLYHTPAHVQARE